MHILPVVYLSVRLLGTSMRSGIRRKGKKISRTTHFRFSFHAIAEVDRKLSYVPECMLVCSRVVQAKDLRGGVLHEVDGRKLMDARGFR
jgi:hypothetical protein